MTKFPYAIPELFQLASGRGLVRIPDQLDVPFSHRVRAVVDTPQFQRLSQIRQLGLTDRVYPGAMHTRFEHALGVYHNALRYLWQLGNDPRFAAIVEERHAELLIVTALLHDLGHWPLAHPIEDLELSGIPEHEEFAAIFLCNDSELGEVLIGQWGVQPAEVLELLSGHATEPALQLLQSILSGPIDIDKLDYLERDSLHCGVPYGRNFDKKRLIGSLMVNEAGNGLALSSKGKTAAELMVFARYVMFSEVYWHHAVRSATAMFSRGFFHLAGDLNLRDFFRMDQTDAVMELRTAAAGTEVESLIEGVFGVERKLHKRVAEYTFSENPRLYERLAWRSYGFLVECGRRLTERLGEQLGRRIKPTDILIDAPARKREIEFDVEIYEAKRERYRHLSEVSPVVETLARTQFDDYVKRVRVFADERLRTAIDECQCFDEILTETLDELASEPGVSDETGSRPKTDSPLSTT